MHHFKLAANIKYQLLNINLFPTYSFKLNKTINLYIRFIRVHLPKRKHVLKSTLLDLFDIKRLVVKRMNEFPDFDSFENIHEIIIATIISLIKVQYNLGYIDENQMTNYIATCLRN
jgi:hypothetical protein